MLYRGALTIAHFRAVARLAVAAAGVEIRADEQLRQRELLARRGADAAKRLSVTAPELHRIAFAHRSLGPRLPLILGLGWRQVELFAEALRATASAEGLMLGSLFNLAIVAFDDLADGDAAGRQDIRALTPELLGVILADPGTASPHVRAALGSGSKPRLALLGMALEQWAWHAASLRARRDDGDRAWSTLTRLITELFEAHAIADEKSNSSGPRDAKRIVAAATRKGALPSEVLLAVATLAGAQGCPPAEVHALAQSLGHLFALLDDTADVLIDLDQDAVNTVVARMHWDEGKGVIGDGDLYDALGHSGRRLAELLGDIAKQAEHVSPEIAAFARGATAAWLDWESVDEEEVRRGLESGPLVVGVAALLHEQSRGYGEATHRLNMPRLDGGYETHSALVQGRAAILDALLDARQAGARVPARVVAEEVLALLQARHRGVRGGWSYVPAVPELPPDADDLGQVLQPLARVGGGTLAAACEEGIRLVLDVSQGVAGFHTWIIDRVGAAPADAAVRAYLPVMGGWGVHAEVVANLGHALWMYDPVRFGEEVRAAAAYLIDMQDPDGAWSSMWYEGRFYGTYKAIALVARVAPGDASLRRARDFLVDAQRDDGSWGEGSADPLSTAFAILASCALGRDAYPERLERGLDALCSMQTSDGTWPACPWVAFDTGSGREAFRSATVTTAFCVKALATAAIDGWISG